MSQSYIPAALRQEVADTFRPWCCYCLTHTNVTGVLLTVDHIIPEALGGMTVRANLCLACWECNLFKGRHTAGLDSITIVNFLCLTPIPSNGLPILPGMKRPHGLWVKHQWVA